MGEPLLSARDIDFSFGRVQVLFSAAIEVGDGERVALLGTNGAGKSTLLRCVSGALTPTSGTVRFDGRDVLDLPPERRFGLGMALVSGGRATFPSLSVLENLRLGAYGFWRDRVRIDARLDEVLELFPQLRTRLGQPAGTLSGGEQQMMALGRGLVPDPKLLLIDELSLGLAPIVLQQLVEVLEELGRRGRTMLIVEQSINVAFGIAERAYFMEKGETRFEGAVGDLMERGDLVRSVFFGG